VFFLACSISAGFMLRLASAISMVPLIKAAIPTPEPPPETSTFTFGATFLYCSAHACARLTIVSEPLTWMEAAGPDESGRAGFEPELSAGPGLLQPANKKQSIEATAAATRGWVSGNVIMGTGI
jgi:hypothetical protein